MSSGSHDVKPKIENAACTTLHYDVTSIDLPFSCPPKNARVWDAHPRIYLPIEELGKVVCPYCGTQYVLKDFISTNNQ